MISGAKVATGDESSGVSTASMISALLCGRWCLVQPNESVPAWSLTYIQFANTTKLKQNKRRLALYNKCQMQQRHCVILRRVRHAGFVSSTTVLGNQGAAPDGQEDSERLPDLVVEAKVADGVDVDLIHLPQHVQRVPFCHIPQHAHRQPRPCTQ